MAQHQKYKRQNKSSKDSGVDNFYVPRDKVVIVEQFADKIKRMYEVYLNFEAPVDSGQWLNLQGDQGDRRNAKNYISAIIQPDETQQIKFPDETCSEFINPQKLEQIEKQTNAFIKPLKNIAEFEICGTELAVTLAMSMMEGIAGNIQQKKNEREEVNVSGDNTYLSPTSAAERLNTSLQRALSDHSDGACSINEYSRAPEAVKRVLVECMEADEIEDDLLFAEGDLRKGGIDLTDDIEMDTDGVNAEVNSDNGEMCPVQKLTKKLTDSGISKKEVTETDISKKQITQVLSKQQEYLKSFGATVGYRPEAISEALNFVDDRTRPSDFLDILNSVSKKNESAKSEDSDDDVVILETSTIDIIDGNAVETIDDQTKAVTNDKISDSKTEKNSGVASPCKRDLPDSYKEMLIRDFMQEDQNCSVDELKKRNVERQRMLKQTFQRQQQGSSASDCNSQQQNKSTSKEEAGVFVKPKGKPASAKKIKNNKTAKECALKRNPHNQNDQQMSCNDRYENDLEQTCVMSPWIPGEEPDCRSRKTAEDEWTVAKRRKPVSGALTAPIAEKKVQPPSQSPNRAQSDLRKPHGPQSPRVHPAGRGKPVQIVSPTNMSNAMGNRPLPPLPGQEDPAELKYIVIDGSNVAVTHGKGSFSSKGIQICVDYFKKRGHKDITVFLPRWRKQWDDHYLQQIQDEGILTLTPSRKIEGKLYSSYDDRFILRLAEEEDGIIVSNDNFRDIMDEKASWKRLVHGSLLMYCFAGDHFMPPDDPLGRDGPTLDDFLRKSKNPQNDSSSQLQQQHERHLNAYHHGNNIQAAAGSSQGHFYPKNIPKAQTEYQPQPVPQGHREAAQGQRQNRQNVIDGQKPNIQNPHNQGRRWSNKGQGHVKGYERPSEPRSDADSEILYKDLKTIFPEEDQADTLRKVLSNHPCETDLTKLTNYCMSVLFP